MIEEKDVTNNIRDSSCCQHETWGIQALDSIRRWLTGGKWARSAQQIEDILPDRAYSHTGLYELQSNWALIELQDTTGIFCHRFSCTEHGFCYGCLQEGSLLYWMAKWTGHGNGNWRTFVRVFIVTAFMRWRPQYQGFIIKNRYPICVAGQRCRRFTAFGDAFLFWGKSRKMASQLLDPGCYESGK